MEPNWCTFAPDQFFGYDFRECCKAHDAAYALNIVSRAEADKNLRV